MEKGKTLHFINRIDENNCGDMMCTPLLYYYDFFRRYNIRRHDIRYIDYETIAPSDVVILGGGGMFDYNEWLNRNIQRLLDTGAAVIAWAGGINTHSDSADKPHTTIDFSRFALAATRDEREDLPWLPDVSCKLVQLRAQYESKRAVGIVCHKDYPIEGIEEERITNGGSVEEIMRFIGESESIVSNSYHVLYWAMLMGKPTACADPFSSKFFSFRHKPAYYRDGEERLADCLARAPRYDILDDYCAANDRFFERVRTMIEQRLEPAGERTPYERATFEAERFEHFRERELRSGDMLCSQLFLDEGRGYSEERKLVAINNVCGDEEYTLRFDLGAYPQLSALRFDPVERSAVRCRLLSVRSKHGELAVRAPLAVSIDGWDTFYTTDPQYFLSGEISEFVELRFGLKLLGREETDQALRSAFALLEQRCETVRQRAETERAAAEQQRQAQEAQISAQARQLHSYSELIDRISDKLDERIRSTAAYEERIAALQVELQREQEGNRLLRRSLSWRITAPLRLCKHIAKKIREALHHGH